MRFRVRLLLGWLLATGFLVVTRCAPAVVSAIGQGDAEGAVQDFCQRFGRQKGLAFVSLFADSARLDLVGLDVSFLGRDGLSRLADYGVAAHSRLAARGFTVSHDTVRCQLDETNDWLKLLGVKQISYGGWFLVSGAKIVRARVSITPASTDEMSDRLPGFLAWLMTQDPKAVQRLLPGGRPAYDSSIVPELIDRLRQWQSRSR